MASRFSLMKNAEDSDMTLEYSTKDPITGDRTTIVKYEHKSADGTIVQKKMTSITRSHIIPLKARHHSALGSSFLKRFQWPWSSTITPRKIPQDAAHNVPKFDEIRRDSLTYNKLWEDPDFPAVDESIFHSRRPPKPFVWKRPKELCSKPLFVSNDFSRFDVEQGELGDCWLQAAVANVTLYPELIHKIIFNADQSFDKDYTGAFHFQFWQYGTWIDVVVDDRLPTYDDKLVFMHSRESDEFWSALLEKAYAKLNGSYESLLGGSTLEAMEDFTGGLCEMFELKEAPNDLFSIMLKAQERESLMGCTIEADPSVFELKQSNGLIRGHAYSITDVKLVSVTLPSGKKGDVQLVRLRNPWGNEAEWNGPWSDRSIEWSSVSDEEKKELGLVFAADGEFWMSFSDFLTGFDKLELCHLSPEAEAYADGEKHKQWVCNSFDGAWVKNSTAGGCRNYLETFAHNPQFHIKLTLTDDDADNQCTCIVALLQKNRRKVRESGPYGDLLTIGFALYKVDVDDENMLAEPLTKEYFRTHKSAARSHAFINMREVCTRFRLPPGNYVIIPSTFDPNEDGEFLLRAFSEKLIEAANIDFDTKYQPVVPVPTVERQDDVDSEDRLDQFFETLAGNDMEIDAWELQKMTTFALKKEFEFDEFSIDTCRSMIAVVDLTRTGKLNLEEFKELWRSIRVWKSSFKYFAKEGNGKISAFEFGNALRGADSSIHFKKFALNKLILNGVYAERELLEMDLGYTLPSRVVTALVLRYANRDGDIEFDDFIGCTVKLKTMIEIFGERDPKKTGEAKFDLNSWLELTMYA